MPAEASPSLWAVFMLGVSLGLTACAVTCLPFIGTLTFGKAAGRASGLADTALFLGGRLLAYTLLGGIAGLLGAGFVKFLADGVGNVVIGLAACLSALLLAGQGQPDHARCGQPGKLAKMPPFILGVSLTLIPCAPLATLLATAAAGQAAGQGAVLGFMFGLGALLTPMIVLIPASASIAARLRSDQPWLADVLRLGAALVLLLIGCRRIASVTPELSLACLLIGLPLGIWLAWPRNSSVVPVAVHPVVFHKPTKSLF